MEPGWSQRLEGRDLRENGWIDQQAVVGLRVRERKPDWSGGSEPRHPAFQLPKVPGPEKRRRGKGRGLCSCRRARWVRSKVGGIRALPCLPPN